MADEYKKFYVGVNVFVVRDGKLLLGERLNVYGAGTWGLPGGHLEPGEAMDEAAGRELLEETSLIAASLEFVNLVNDRHGGQHRLQVGFEAMGVSGESELREPERCREWRWFPLGELPANLFVGHRQQIALFRERRAFGEGA
jgi:8-oxo-dGTP diphosphatase